MPSVTAGSLGKRWHPSWRDGITTIYTLAQGRPIYPGYGNPECYTLVLAGGLAQGLTMNTVGVAMHGTQNA